MDFIKGKVKDLVKDLVKKKVEETDFSELILQKLDKDMEEIISDKVYNALVEALKNLDDDVVANLAVQAKNKMLTHLENNDELIRQITQSVISKIVKNLESDEEFRNTINTKIKEVINNVVEKY